MTLSTEQRRDLTADLGIADDESVFSDAELDRHYARAEEDYDLALYYALRQLLIDPVKFNRYAECSAEKDRELLRKALSDALDRQGKVAGVGGKLSAGVITTGLDQPDPATDTTYDDYLRDF